MIRSSGLARSIRTSLCTCSSLLLAVSAAQGQAPLRDLHGKCLELVMVETGKPAAAAATIVLDTVRSQSRQDGWRRATVAGRAGWARARGSWRLLAHDSVELRVIFVDSGARIVLGVTSQDTLRGNLRRFGLEPDTVTVYPALGIRRSSCEGA